MAGKADPKAVADRKASRKGQAQQKHSEPLSGDGARYHALLDSALDCIIWTDERGRIQEFNSAAERTFRTSRSEVIGKDLSETILPAALRPHLRSELFASAASSGVEIVGNRLETKVMRAGGSGEFPAELTVTSAVIQGTTTFIVYVRDLTARRLAEQTLVRLAAIVESSQDAIVGTDLNNQITSWNKGAELMYGYTAPEVTGQNILLLAPPDRVDESVRVRELSKTGVPIQSFETVRVAKDGRRLDVSLSISPVLDSDGVVVGASAIARDITAYKQAQDALRKASETSIYACPMPIIAVDADRRITMWNPAAQAVFGWSEEEVMGKPNPITLRGGTDEAAGLHKRALAGETLTGIELHGRKRNGAFVAISLSATPLFDGQQKIRGIIGFLADITEIKRAEEALRSAEQKYRTIFEDAMEGIYQITPQGGYISANPSLARMLGFESPAELIEMREDIRNQGYVHPEMYEEFVSWLRRNCVVQNFEYQVYRKDKKVIWVSENAHSVRDADGQILYFEGTVQDITERRELEQQLRMMQKIEAVGRLAGGVAHDFNNLLMAISSYAELLQLRIPEKDQGRKYLDEIVRVVDRGASLTQGLLTFSRKQVVSPKVLDLNAVIADQIKMLRRLVPENIDLKFTAGSGLGRIKADQSQIEQVVMNLVINARDAMPDGGAILIETGNSDSESGEKCVLVSISDNGCGMDAVTKAQIFEPFFTTKGQGKGTGLGLAIVADIIKQSGGQTFVQSEPGVGTTFKVYFPKVDGALQNGKQEDLDSSYQGNETILLVEDEDTVRESIAEYLKQKGYTVLKANGGPQAITVVSEFKQKIHLMLTDVIMPQMSGRELVDKIKDSHPGIKAVFMSGYSNNLLSHRQVLDPRHVLLQKPVRLTALAKCLREMLDQSKPASAGR
jgi:two-component system, cell cycle sensor histidine kinase and response regulator CckA